jgi:hypothetical protein
MVPAGDITGWTVAGISASLSRLSACWRTK